MPDAEYLKLILDALHVCRRYKPKFGKRSKSGLTREEFRALYQADVFYTWFGLDSPFMYAAHKAAGGITSVYRQIGIACERLFRRILQDTLRLTDEQVAWSYEVPGARGNTRTLSLDARIPLGALPRSVRSQSVREWVGRAAKVAKVENKVAARLNGVVFEVRQGYKSKDSKRQNADIGNAANAYASAYLPCAVILSTQIDTDIEERYARAQWVILKGTTVGTSLDSTYVFAQEVLGYDLAGFFTRNSPAIEGEVEGILKELLR